MESDLGIRVTNKVVQRLVDAGQMVKRKQPLMRIDLTDYGHALIAQSGNVAAARAKWIQTAADGRRNRGLVVTGAMSQSADDQVKAASDTAKAILDADAAQERVARNQEHYALLPAGSDGTVMQTLAEPGPLVAAGQTVLRLAHARPRKAAADLPETVRPELSSKAGAALYGGIVNVETHLRQLSGSADSRTRTSETRYAMFGIDADAPLGATVTDSPTQHSQAETFSIPLGAVDDERRGPGVRILDDRSFKVAYRPVVVRSFRPDTVEIGGGIRNGELVVAAGGHELHAGE